ncbi:cellulase family glycosylhydrolase [Myxococcota bacterium]|nr:cellulase family glycosylhydrolase [Myxococcota bacterium]
MRAHHWGILGLIWLGGCQGEPPPTEATFAAGLARVRVGVTAYEGIDGRVVTQQTGRLRDALGREVYLRGINVSGSHKAPPTEAFPSLYPLPQDAALAARCRAEIPMPPECVPSRDVSYVGRPFPLDEADVWFGQIAGLGFNSIRLLTNWESIQPYRPGTCVGREGYDSRCHDLTYLDYFEALIIKAKAHGLYVLIDMHQDIFSRHLFAYYNEAPPYGAPGSLEATLFSLLPPYSDWVRGHGAPRWVVQAALPEKDMDSPYWGIFRALGAMRGESGALDPQNLANLLKLFNQLMPSDGGGAPAWINDAFERLPPHFEPHQSSDFLPWTYWPLNGLLSLDADRCFAAFFAGDEVFPALVVDVDGLTKRRDEVADPAALPSLQAYLQGEYIEVLRALARRGGRHENVIGYDLMNEPVGTFLLLTLAAAFIQADGPSGLEGILEGLLGADLGQTLHALIIGLNLLPPDTAPETLRAWGLADIDLLASVNLNLAFDERHLQPFFERAGQAVQAEDPNAIIWIEPGATLRTLTGPSFQWDSPLTRPQGVDQVVFAPHWYPDIYPKVGLNVSPRQFNPDEWLYRDFRAPLAAHIEHARAFLGNAPVVFGEFGTYFNYGSHEASREAGYETSAHILNAYYEAFEDLGVGNMLWCFSADNSAKYGELWNHEDFSIIDPDGAPRAWPAYARPYARATSGRLIQQRFYSQYHAWDPVGGAPRPDRIYTLEMHPRETTAPTEIYAPQRQYPDGFYVWISDGGAYFDAARQILYWYPDAQAEGTRHALRIEPPRGVEVIGWRYFFKGDRVLERGAR